MSDILLIIGGLSLVALPIGIIIFIIQCIRHKHKKKWGFICLALLICFIVSESLGIAFMCNHNYSLIAKTDATCSVDGSETYYCSECGKEKVVTVPKTDHNFVEINHQEPTVSTEGKITNACLDCGIEELIVLEKLPLSQCPHNWIDATCTTAKICSICKQSSGTPNDHEFVITDKTEATFSASGTIVYSCSYCGLSQTETIPVLECTHDWKQIDTQQECSICGLVEENHNVSFPDNTPETANPSVEPESFDYTNYINVTFNKSYVDGKRLHLKVYVKNDSDKIFDGNVHVIFSSVDGRDILGSDTIFVEELLPGRECWANVIIDDYLRTPNLEVDFTEVRFTDITEIDTEIDTAATDNVKNSYRLSFEDVSWYSDITNILVYTDGNCQVELSQSPKNNAQSYAATIWSCGNDYGIKIVRVVDQDGNILCVFP